MTSPATMTASHHPDCDGFLMSVGPRVERGRYSNGTPAFSASCVTCGAEMVGSAGSESAPRDWVRRHGCPSVMECDSRCLAWDVEVAR